MHGLFGVRRSVNAAVQRVDLIRISTFFLGKELEICVPFSNTHAVFGL